MAEDPGSERQRQPVGVLAVDDYLPNLTALEALLEPIGTITAVDSGARAIEEIGRRDYAVVILDVQMPRMDGLEVARRIRAGTRNAQVPIIFLTAMDSDAAPILDGYAAGAVDYLRRPLDPVVLKSKVSIFIELYQSREHAKEEAAERVRLEAERAAAEQASQEKDRFLSLLSHELRTPLTSILLWSDMLLNKQLPPDTVRRGLEAVDICARHEAHIVENVLETSRLVTGALVLESTTVDIEQLIADAVADLARYAAERHVEVVCIPGMGSRHVQGDRARLRHVLHNVLENAVKFTAPGGWVDVAVEETDSAYQIRIKDTGIGFGPELRPKLFTRFKPGDTSSSGAQNGLGLGLALSKAVLDLHGGAIAAESEGVGEGAVFTITLPR